MTLLERLVIVGLLVAACGEEPPVEPPVPSAIVINVSDTLTTVNGGLTFSAVVIDAQGQPVNTAPITWSVSDTLRGRIGGDGVFTGGPYVGPVHVHARLESAMLAESVGVRIVPPGTVRWRWAVADLGGVLPTIGGPTLALDGTIYVLVERAAPDLDPAVLVAINPQGTLRWQRDLMHVSTNYAVVVPGTGDVWVVGENIYLTSAEGTPVWDTALVDGQLSPIFLGGAATTDLLIANQGKTVVAYSADDRRVLWESQFAPSNSWLVPPTVTADGRVLVKRTRDTLFAFAATSGQLLDSFLDPDTGVDLRVFGVGTVPVGSRYYLPTHSRLAAYDTSGVLLWLTANRAWGMTEPAVAPDGSLYVQTRGDGLWALNSDGAQRWRRHEIQPRWPWLGGVALAEGGIIYAPGLEGFYATASDGTPLWTFSVDSAGTRQSFIGSPAIAPDGTVYTWTSTHLYAFWGPAPPEPNSPWPMWRHDAQRTGWAR